MCLSRHNFLEEVFRITNGCELYVRWKAALFYTEFRCFAVLYALKPSSLNLLKLAPLP